MSQVYILSILHLVEDFWNTTIMRQMAANLVLWFGLIVLMFVVHISFWSFSSKSIHCAAMCSTSPNCEVYYFDTSKCYEGTAKCLMLAPVNVTTEKTVFIKEDVLREYESNDRWGNPTNECYCYAQDNILFPTSLSLINLLICPMWAIHALGITISCQG